MELAPLTEADRELIAHARDAIDANRDGENHTHTVGAAVRDSEGRVHVGVNLYHFTGGPCAELVALATARTQGARRLATIVAVGDQGRGVLAPCGRDRQVLFDLYPSIRVIMPGRNEPVVVPASGLLPGAYSWTAQSEGRISTVDET